MPLNLWIQCNMSRKGTTLRAERERERGPACFDLCYAMQSNRETAQIKGPGWNSSAGWRLWFCIGVKRALGWISCISHTGSCPPCHKNNKHAAKGMRGALQACRGKQNVVSRQQCGANWRCTVVNIYPSAPTSVVKSNSIQGQSQGQLWFRQPLPSHSHPDDINRLCSTAVQRTPYAGNQRW